MSMNRGSLDKAQRCVWLSEPQEALKDLDRTVTLDWTELDVSSIVPPNAQNVILQVMILADVIGTGNYSMIAVRPQNYNWGHYPMSKVDKNGVATVKYRTTLFELPVQNGKIKYSILVGTGWTVDSLIYIFGYTKY